jgi:hypothetical protein
MGQAIGEIRNALTICRCELHFNLFDRRSPCHHSLWKHCFRLGNS